jgi:hypothetical protein
MGGLSKNWLTSLRSSGRANRAASLRPADLFSNGVHWAKSYLSKANLVEITRRGHFMIADASRGRHPTLTFLCYKDWE